jgi:HNH endonuclease
MRLPPLLQRRTKRVPIDGEIHLLVEGRSDKYGYARYGAGCKLAHRIAYECYFGPIPAGFHVHHTCGIRSCIEKTHLEAITPEENRGLRTWPRASIVEQKSKAEEWLAKKVPA